MINYKISVHDLQYIFRKHRHRLLIYFKLFYKEGGYGVGYCRKPYITEPALGGLRPHRRPTAKLLVMRKLYSNIGYGK